MNVCLVCGAPVADPTLSVCGDERCIRIFARQYRRIEASNSRRRERKPSAEVRKCRRCNTEFVPVNKVHMFCCRRCKMQASNARARERERERLREWRLLENRGG